MPIRASMNRAFKCLLSIAVPGLLLASVPAKADTAFSLQQFDVPQSASTEADGINDAGTIVGFFVDRSGLEHGFLRQYGAFTQLDFPGSKTTRTVGINNFGDVVGSFTEASGAQHGLVRENGTFVRVDFPGAASTAVLAINAALWLPMNVDFQWAGLSRTAHLVAELHLRRPAQAEMTQPEAETRTELIHGKTAIEEHLRLRRPDLHENNSKPTRLRAGEKLIEQFSLVRWFGMYPSERDQMSSLLPIGDKTRDTVGGE